MSSIGEERGKNYNTGVTPVEGAEVAVDGPESLDFFGRRSVNPEEPGRGGPP